MLTAHRVICDFPSTGFYESVVAGVPTMSLYHEAFIVRKSAVDYFGNLLKPFSEIPEAIRHIDKFLNSDPELYRTTSEIGDESVLHIFRKGWGERYDDSLIFDWIETTSAKFFILTGVRINYL